MTAIKDEFASVDIFMSSKEGYKKQSAGSKELYSSDSSDG
jgi:hypothetical protein